MINNIPYLNQCNNFKKLTLTDKTLNHIANGCSLYKYSKAQTMETNILSDINNERLEKELSI